MGAADSDPGGSSKHPSKHPSELEAGPALGPDDAGNHSLKEGERVIAADGQ